MMDILKKETVHMKNPDIVEKKLHELADGGPSKLQVISDFDLTLSRVHKDGVKCATTWGLLKQEPFVSKEYLYQANQLASHYRPIEQDPNINRADKTRYMMEWYVKGLELMPMSGFSKDSISECVKTNSSSENVCLRDGADFLCECLNKHNVPLLIFSAGLADILKEVLKQQNLFLPNMKIIANFMRFDEKNKLQGYKNSLIHPFNKNVASIANDDYFQTLRSRNNIILLGDGLGDVDMSEGIRNVNAVLKIGFLNFRIEESLPDYLNAYDIVLTDDQTMDVVNGILQKILC